MIRHIAHLRGITALALSGFILAGLAGAPAGAQDERPLFAVSGNAADGKVTFTLPAPGADGSSDCYIYAAALRSGLGSADIVLDRGMLGREQLLCFRRMGAKVAAIFENPAFRASGDADTQKGASESFATSVAAMLPIESEERTGLVVDMTPFLMLDTIGIAGSLARAGEAYKAAPGLSAVDAASLKAFPRNVEVDAVQTFASDKPGPELSRLAPDPRQLSFTVHHSFVALPEPGYVMRLNDPRAPAFGPTLYDYGAPLGEPVAIQLASRFRLEKTDPAAARSPVKQPIVFYIDPAAPEPVRTALVEGVNYWASAFDRAGFIDAFRAEVLPQGADPLDVRYNMVNWSNRLTRGWSYGGGIMDPRTGEIIKGNVVIGALRVRQDIAIFEGLVGTAGNGTGGPDDPVRAALARMRQLGAHEVGHAIGFMHNFAASTQGRSSVMDYPGPLIGLTPDGRIDLSDAYAPGGGAWDDFSVDWLYGEAPPGVDPEMLADQKAAAATDLAFISDIDGRDPSLPSPIGSMWENGPDPVADLTHMLAVREVALANFGEQVLLPGEPMAFLRRKFVPIWLLHRYGIEAAGKVIGGLDYQYKVVGDDNPLPAPFPAALQNAAIDTLLATLSPARLTIPDRLVPMLSVPATALDDPQFTVEVFRNSGAAAFDPLVAADVAAQLALDSLLAPDRLARLLEQHRRDPSLPGAGEVVDRIVSEVIGQRGDDVARRIAYRAIITMAEVERDPATSPGVAAILGSRLDSLASSLASGGAGEAGAWGRHVGALLADEDRLEGVLDQPEAAPAIPPGMPIGGDSGWFDG